MDRQTADDDECDRSDDDGRFVVCYPFSFSVVNTPSVFVFTRRLVCWVVARKTLQRPAGSARRRRFVRDRCRAPLL